MREDWPNDIKMGKSMNPVKADSRTAAPCKYIIIHIIFNTVNVDYSIRHYYLLLKFRENFHFPFDDSRSNRIMINEIACIDRL